LTDTGAFEGKNILVTTVGTFLQAVNSRKGIDLSELKCIVFDEADFFFAN